MRRLGLLLGAMFLPLAAVAEDTIFTASFPTSCSSAVQGEFDEAVTLLHSFEYPETERRFAALIATEPTCAMAYWGLAMSLWHPLWAPPGGAELARGNELLAEASQLSTTPREAAYLSALQAFYVGGNTSHAERAAAYESAMSRVYEDHLDDPEAALFYALALLASADPKDKTYTHQFKSAALLNWVRKSQPEHPGALHYLIHSYDFPGLAHLALEEAMLYAETAPNSAHAQHMPSHIFTRLGLWELSIASNHDSTRSAEAYTRRAHLSGHYDEGLHSMDYLLYALLQTARDEEARELLATLATIKRTNTENFKVAYTYAAGPARYTLERRAWEEASRIELIRENFPWDEFTWAESIHYFARGIGAARSGNIEMAKQNLKRIREIETTLPDTVLPYWREEVQVHLEAVSAWILLAEGDRERSLVLAAAAADREDSVDKHPVTPGEVLPARELYADMLLETGDYASALDQYLMVLDGSPNRLNALLGAGKAAQRSGLEDLAQGFYQTALEQTSFGNRERAGLEFARGLQE